ncbi:MAG: ATP-dependent transcriptional regulator, MalT-like, LuxR family [Acidimicrobiales bacterium]|nr:ATP-dependent transcriptional regulator, MalT-like, LuxR family [Acidimicrobiales bacterium]
MSAAAGFGKTTLVAEWFADGPATAWLSLDRRDNDPALFWTYVVAALQFATPAAGATARALLEAPQPSFDAVVATLLNDLHAVAHEVVLVLDDYHVIDSPEIHEAVAFLLTHLPPHVHLVIASRADPPLPLATLRARGDLLEIRAADLRFTSGEAAAYLNDAMDLTLAPADVELLEARTEGWIAALQLAALSMQGREDIAGFIAEFAGDDRFILDYLVGEVLDRQSTDVRSFLLQTSILGRLTGPLCDAVTDREGSRTTLEQIERANLFLVPLDDRRAWYRYHHLFADVLRARLLDEAPGQLSELHRRASDWYDAGGDPSEAITHAMAGEHFERAARLIELAAPLMHRRRQESTFRRWLEALPDEVFHDRPVLTITLVGARMATGDPTGVEPLLRLVESALETSTPPPIVFDDDEFDRLPAHLSVYRAALALLAGDIDGAIAHATRALDLAEPTDHLLRGSATGLLGLAYWATGGLDTAERCYTEAVRCFITAEHLPDMLGCSLALADIQIAQGRLGDATRTFESGLRWTTEHLGLRGAADMHVGLSEVLIERNDLDAAARHLEASSELGEHAGLPQNPYRWRVAMARLRHAHGDLDGALELLEEALPLYNTDFSPPVRPVAALRARVQLARGGLDAALRWAAERGLTADDDLSYVDEFEHLTVARTLIARHAAEHDAGALEDALALLNRLLVAAEDGQRTGSAIEILVMLATAHHARGDVPAAAAALEDALRRAGPEGYLRVFLDAGPAVAALLRSLESDGTATPHLRRVIAAADPPRTSTSSRPTLVDDLSARELDVLRLLRSDLSGPEIASELLVSLNTFRTHTKSIYTKLGVNNRREAIRRGTQLGL